MKTTILLLLSAAASHAATDRLLSAIAQTESRSNHLAVGDAGRAVSAYQLHSSAWADANAYRLLNGLPPISRSEWQSPAQAKAIASAYCDLIAARLTKAGVQASPENIYAAYTCGLASFRAADYNITRLSSLKRRGISRFIQFYR